VVCEPTTVKFQLAISASLRDHVEDQRLTGYDANSDLGEWRQALYRGRQSRRKWLNKVSN
jgi:hypothetical protein